MVLAPCFVLASHLCPVATVLAVESPAGAWTAVQGALNKHGLSPHCLLTSSSWLSFIVMTKLLPAALGPASLSLFLAYVKFSPPQDIGSAVPAHRASSLDPSGSCFPSSYFDLLGATSSWRPVLISCPLFAPSYSLLPHPFCVPCSSSLVYFTRSLSTCSVAVVRARRSPGLSPEPLGLCPVYGGFTQ